MGRHGKAVVRVKSVADLCTCRVGQVRHHDVDLIGTIGCEDQHLAKGEGKEVVQYVPLNVIEVPSLGSLASLVDGRNEFVHFTTRVHVRPKSLSVIWIATAAEALLVSVVKERYSSRCKRENNGVLEACHVVLREEACIIVVIHKRAQDVNVSKGGVVKVVISLSYEEHGLAGTKNILYCKEHGIVEEGGHIVLVVSHIVGISVKYLTHLKDASSLTVLGPERLRHVRDCVDADSVEIEAADSFIYPFFEIRANKIIVLV